MSNNLLALIDRFSSQKILIIGEAMLDRYLKGTTNRLSQEAPVQVVSVDEKEDIPGGAANTATNIRSLGAEPILLTMIGDDDEGKMLRCTLQSMGISDEHLLSSPNRKTLAKQRVVANGQMMIRFDQGSTHPLGLGEENLLIQHLLTLASQVDGIIVSDYNYGILTPNVLKAIASIQKRAPHILVVDAKQYKAYQALRVTAIKPNYAEAIKILKLEPKEGKAERVRQIEKHGHKLLDAAKAQIAAVTLDQDGSLIFQRGEPVYRIYARPAEHNRVAGAGDTFISALALALSTGVQTTTAAEVASAAASIVVEKPGTSTCFIEELKGYFTGEEKYITDSFHMAARVAAYRRQGKRIVFTNGCFDILHSGHIQYLNQAKAQGHVLIVGINSDSGVRRLKGPTRPINTLEERAQVLSALSCVDHIIPFDEDIPFSLIRLIQPDIFVKGGDYTRDKLPEAALVEEMGGMVHILPYIENHSTSGIIERIQQTLVNDLVNDLVSDLPNKELAETSLIEKKTDGRALKRNKSSKKQPAAKEPFSLE